MRCVIYGIKRQLMRSMCLRRWIGSVSKIINKMRKPCSWIVRRLQRNGADNRHDWKILAYPKKSCYVNSKSYLPKHDKSNKLPNRRNGSAFQQQFNKITHRIHWTQHKTVKNYMKPLQNPRKKITTIQDRFLWNNYHRLHICKPVLYQYHSQKYTTNNISYCCKKQRILNEWKKKNIKISSKQRHQFIFFFFFAVG